MSNESAPRLTTTQWLVLTVAAIGFLFDTYELLMTPLVGVPAIADLLGLPANHPSVTTWMGRMLWITALCGGVFGLLGGWLIDRFGRKRIMAASIFVYALSPFAASFSTSLEMFIFFRATTFIGVCVEFVAAITWLAELFPDKRQKERALGWTQAFASLGGLLVTGINTWIVANAASLPSLPVPEMFNGHASWRYLLITGLLPAIPIALLLPFVPESQVWREKRAAGTLKRPSFGALFAPELRRVTLVTAALSACAYGAAFGALQLTPLRVAPGLPELKTEQDALRPLAAEAKTLNAQLDELLAGEKMPAPPAAAPVQSPPYKERIEKVPGLAELAAKRAKNRIEFRATTKLIKAGEAPVADEATKQKAEIAKIRLAVLANSFAGLNLQFQQLTTNAPDAKAAVMAREKIMKALGDNRDAQEPLDKKVKERGNSAQLYQELGGLTGRIILALLLVTALARGRMLRMFIIPGLAVLPLTYTSLYGVGGPAFNAAIFVCGLLVVAQFSYFGEYLPKIFPLHLRGTGGSFATNVGGRMIGTSCAFLTTNLIAPMLGGASTFDKVALAAAIVGTGVFAIGFFLSFLLPEPPKQLEESR